MNFFCLQTRYMVAAWYLPWLTAVIAQTPVTSSSVMTGLERNLPRYQEVASPPNYQGNQMSNQLYYYEIMTKIHIWLAQRGRSGSSSKLQCSVCGLGLGFNLKGRIWCRCLQVRSWVTHHVSHRWRNACVCLWNVPYWSFCAQRIGSTVLVCI